MLLSREILIIMGRGEFLLNFFDNIVELEIVDEKRMRGPAVREYIGHTSIKA